MWLCAAFLFLVAHPTTINEPEYQLSIFKAKRKGVGVGSLLYMACKVTVTNKYLINDIYLFYTLYNAMYEDIFRPYREANISLYKFLTK